MSPQKLKSTLNLMAGASALIMLSACSGATTADAPTAVQKTAQTLPEICATPNTVQARPECWYESKSGVARNAAEEARVAEILASLTLEQKVAQLVQGDIGSLTPADVGAYQLGSVLNGGNSAPGGDNRAAAPEWLALADELWDASVAAGPVPYIWGTDAVHGHNNVVGATIFPHNIGLGAARDPDLIERIGAVTAREVRVTGMDWTFAPTLAVVQNDRWGRTYESYSEMPDVVASYAGHMVWGLQGRPGSPEFLGPEKVIATTKHFVGDGGTTDGIDQGNTEVDEAVLRDIHAAGYVTAIEAGTQSAMASYNTWHGRKMHGNKDMLTDVLVGRMGFDGFVVGDWNGHGQVAGCTNEDCAQAMNAGLDMYMAPNTWKGVYESTLAHAKSGEIPMSRIDEAAARILRVKVRAGIFEQVRPSKRPLAGQFELLGSAAHRAVAREAVRKSLVLLKNEGGVLPVKPGATVLVTGAGANDVNMQNGGWTLTWQGDGNARENFPNGVTILEGLTQAIEATGGKVITDLSEGTPDVAIVVYGEQPYAEFRGDVTTLDFQTPDNAHLAQLAAAKSAGVPTVSVFLSGRPMWVNEELNASDAFVAAWLPGSEAGGMSDVLVAKADGTANFDFHGKLSFSWPKKPDQFELNYGQAGYDPLFPFGFGLTYGDDGSLAQLDTSYVVAGGDGNVLFADGKAQSPWSIVLTEPGAETGATVVDARTETAGGAITAQMLDRNAQEDSVQFTFTGAGGQAGFYGSVLDWQRDANADIALKIAYRVDTAPAGAAGLAMRTDNALTNLDMTAAFAAKAGQGWQEGLIPLRCFSAQGANMAGISHPLIITSTGDFAMTISSVTLDTSIGGTSCTLD